MAVVIALCISVLGAGAKLFVGLEASSSALLASTIHSLIDASCLGLLFLGLWNVSAAPIKAGGGPDRVLYFWSFVVAIVLYSMGGGIALYEGAERLARPQPLVNSLAGMQPLILALTLAAAGGVLAAMMAFREMKSANTSTNPMAAAIHRPELAPAIAVLLIAAASIAGNVLALGGLLGAANGGDQRSDPFAAIAVGLTMSAVAAFMAIEVKRVIGAEHVAADAAHRAPAVVRDRDGDASPWIAEARPAPEIKSMPAAGQVASAVAAASSVAKSEAAVEIKVAAESEAPRFSNAGGSAQKPSVTARQAGRKGRGKRRR